LSAAEGREASLNKQLRRKRGQAAAEVPTNEREKNQPLDQPRGEPATERAKKDEGSRRGAIDSAKRGPVNSGRLERGEGVRRVQNANIPQRHENYTELLGGRKISEVDWGEGRDGPKKEQVNAWNLADWTCWKKAAESFHRDGKEAKKKAETGRVWGEIHRDIVECIGKGRAKSTHLVG